MSHYCYLLRSLSTNRTYIGYTNDLNRRLRQHNGEIKGGAKSTKNGRPWKIVCYVTGFKDKVTALQFEWRNHHPPTKRYGLYGRIDNLSDILSLNKWTCNSPISSSLNLTLHWLEDLHLPKCPSYCTEICYSETPQ